MQKWYARLVRGRPEKTNCFYATSPTHRITSKVAVAASLLLFCRIFLLFAGTTPVRVSPPTLEDEDALVQELVSDLGRKAGVTFTIEEVWSKDGGMAPIRGFRHRKPTEAVDIKTALDELSQSVPNFAWRNDQNNPQVIHIIDDRLVSRKGYALDSVIDNIDFSGTVLELVDTIATKGVPVSSVGLFSTTDLLSMDGVTRLQVKGKSMRVRDALSDFVPLEGRGPILWTAGTHIDSSDQTSYIKFHGAPPQSATPTK